MFVACLFYYLFKFSQNVTILETNYKWELETIKRKFYRNVFHIIQFDFPQFKQNKTYFVIQWHIIH